MKLELERCTIRDWRMDDAESLAKRANNRQVWLGLRDAFPHPYGIEDAKKFLHEAGTEHAGMRFCIEIDGAAAGGLGLRLGEDVHLETAQIRYLVGQGFCG